MAGCVRSSLIYFWIYYIRLTYRSLITSKLGISFRLKNSCVLSWVLIMQINTDFLFFPSPPAAGIQMNTLPSGGWSKGRWSLPSWYDDHTSSYQYWKHFKCTLCNPSAPHSSLPLLSFKPHPPAMLADKTYREISLRCCRVGSFYPRSLEPQS